MFLFSPPLCFAPCCSAVSSFSHEQLPTPKRTLASRQRQILPLPAVSALLSFASCETNIPPLLDDEGNAPDQNTLKTICEIEEVLGGSAFGTQGGSLQVAIYCDAPTAVVGTSGTPCGTAGNVWVCARSYDSNGYPAIIGPSWVTDQQEELIPAGAQIEYSTFYPAPSSADSDATTLSCGP